MDPLVTIAGTAFDAVHVSLVLLLIAAGLAAVWLKGRIEADIGELRRARETAEAEAEAAATGLAEREAHLDRLKSELSEANTRLAVAEARSEEERKAFAAMAHDAVRNAHAAFLERANETFEKHKSAATSDLQKLMGPIGETFSEFKQRVDAIEKVRTEHRSALQQQIETISKGLQHNAQATSKLVSALSAPRGGGSWGEESLRNVMELAGMSAYADFNEQTHEETERGTMRPDVIIRMPGGREIVVDAKVSVEDFLKAAGEADPQARSAHLIAHARKMKDHVKRLAGKAYWKDFEDRVDFVAMYVPGEQFYSGALEADRGLFDFAARNKVLIVTPSTLIALAKAVAYGWRQEEAARNAREAADLGRQLYDALTAMGGHVERLGKSLNASVGAYNGFVGSLERNVLPKARRFETLQIAQAGAKEIAPLAGLEQTPRLPDRSGELDFGDDAKGKTAAKGKTDEAA